MTLFGEKRQWYYLDIPQLRSTPGADILKAIEESKLRTVAIDFTEIEYVDSETLTFLFHIYKELSPQGIRIILLNPKSQTLRVFKIMQLGRIFEIKTVNPGLPD